MVGLTRTHTHLAHVREDLGHSSHCSEREEAAAFPPIY